MHIVNYALEAAASHLAQDILRPIANEPRVLRSQYHEVSVFLDATQEASANTHDALKEPSSVVRQVEYQQRFATPGAGSHQIQVVLATRYNACNGWGARLQVSQKLVQ